MDYMVKAGTLIKHPEPSRGAMLLLEEGAWMSRYLISSKGERILLPIYTLSLMALFDIVAFFFMRFEIGLFLLLLFVTIVPFGGAFAYVHTAMNRMPTPGLYETGLQYPRNIFIPYDEVYSLNIETHSRNPKFTYVQVKLKKMPPELSENDLRVPIDFIGTNGIELLRQRTMAPSSLPH